MNMLDQGLRVLIATSTLRSRAHSTSGAFELGTTAEAVRAQKLRIDPTVRALDASVVTCTKLTNEERVGYIAFSQSWRAYFDGPDSGLLGFGTGPLFDTGQAFAQQAQTWKNLIDSKCGSSGPSLPGLNEQTQAGTDALQLLGWAGIALAVAWGMSTVMRKP
jgi:hypothetical protein